MQCAFWILQPSDQNTPFSGAHIAVGQPMQDYADTQNAH